VSGQLVGEVIDAADRLKSSGLSERGFHALLAIAEKCHTTSRQGSVRWDHIRAALYWASMSTAKRAVHDLRSAGLVKVIKRGFDNHAGRACAPIYEIAPLPERVTQVTQSPDPERVTQVTQSPEGERVKTEGRTGQIGGRTGHLGDLLDVSIDGSLDVCAADAAPQPASTPQPNPYCAEHMPWGTEDDCRKCGRARTRHERWLADKPAHDREVAQARERARKNCHLCAGHGWVLGSDGTPVEPATRCPACTTTQHREDIA
jgi:hypothetical protein